MTKLLVFYYSSPLLSNHSECHHVESGDDFSWECVGTSIVWQLCFLVTMLRRRYDAINRENMIRVMKFLCSGILQIVTSRLWFHPDNTRHIFHHSLSKNILTSAKKTPRRSRTGSQLRDGEVAGNNIWHQYLRHRPCRGRGNIWAIWWRSTRHRTGDESLENAEPRVIPGSRVVVKVDFYNVTVFRIYKSLEYVLQTRTVERSFIPRWLRDRVRQVFSLPRNLATRLLWRSAPSSHI